MQLDPEATVRLALPSMAAPVPDAPLPDPALPATAAGRDGRDPGASVQAVARGGGANLIGAAVTTVANLLLSVVVARSMSQANAGIFFSITSLVLLLATVGRVGTGGLGADGERGHGGHADRRRRSRQGSDDALSEH